MAVVALVDADASALFSSSVMSSLGNSPMASAVSKREISSAVVAGFLIASCNENEEEEEVNVS